MSQRPVVIIGNWKMNKTIAEARQFISALAPVAAKSKREVGIALPFTMLNTAAEIAMETTIMIGAQNVSDKDHGAYTGEVSCAMVKDAGATFTLVGHSERRHIFHENDAMINEKIIKCLKIGINPVFCIGETLDEHQSGNKRKILEQQILQGLKGLEQKQVEDLVIAYEPVWAIGTNRAATPDIVQETHAYCRNVIAKEWGKKVADHVVIQYGGSVTATNAAALLEQTDVDGLLVGGASLTLDSFSKIVLAGI
jgi:triosephosphate isomerase